ncbi:MAG: hypothetical protein ABW003_23655 [Microvirga sp.]
MTRTILDPRTGTLVNFSVPEERHAPRARRWPLGELDRVGDHRRNAERESAASTKRTG